MTTSIEQRFLDWARRQSPACQEAILAGRAAVMPVKDVPIVYGTNESYADAPGRVRVIHWAEKSLQLRLDTP